MNGILSLCYCRLSGADTQTLPAVITKFELFALTVCRDAKTSPLHPCARSWLGHLVELSPAILYIFDTQKTQ